MLDYVAGIDIGGTTIKLGLFPEYGSSVTIWEIKTPSWAEIDHIYERIRDALYEKMESLAIPRESLKAAAMGIPGPVTVDGYLSSGVNLGMGAGFPARELNALLHIPTAVLNDASSAALGEVYFGAAKGCRNAVLMTIGTGVGGGVVVDGKVILGNRGLGGEIGHFVVNPSETESCNCGNKGCLEQYSSATGIVRSAKKMLADPSVQSSLRGVENLTAKDVLDAAKEGDIVGLEALEIFGKYLGMAAAHLLLTVDPDRIIIGGGVSKAGDILIKAMSKYLDAYTHIAPRKGEVVLASLGNNAGMYGAAHVAFGLLEKK